MVEHGRVSLNLPSSIAAEISRMTTIEMKSEIVGSVRADYLNAQYQPVIDDARLFTEYAAAKGGVMLKPYIDGDSISIDYVQADCFYPTAFDSSGNITGCIFVDQKTRGNKIYTRLE